MPKAQTLLGSNEEYVPAKPRFPDCPILSSLVLCFPCCVPCTMWGLRLKNNPQIPFDAAKQAADGGTYAVAADGRKVEYFVYGARAPDAKVIVNLHGSGFTAKAEAEFYGPICLKLGVKGISVSWGGHGYSDGLLGRKVVDWPQTDLEPVLAKEGVDKFMVTGHSSGNPHALAAAWHFPNRVIGLGLNAACNSAPTAKKHGLVPAMGQESLPTTADLKKCHNSWYFAVMRLASLFSGVMINQLAKTNPGIKSDAQLRAYLEASVARGTIRGTGFPFGWETAMDTCYEWGFDPEEIQCKNVVVWHAEDDHECPIDHGKWLAKMFGEKGALSDAKHPADGFGHFHFYQGEAAKPKTSLVNQLLKGV